MNFRKSIGIVLIIVILFNFFSACAKLDDPTDSSEETNTEPTTSVPPETTVPATTEFTETNKLTYKTICSMLDEAENYFASNQTISVASNFYTQTYVEKQKLLLNNYVTEEDGNFVFCDVTDENMHVKLHYLVFLSILVDRYSDDMIWTAYDFNPDGASRPQWFIALLFEDYDILGFDTVKDYFDSGMGVQPNTVEFRVTFESPLITMQFRDGDYKLSYYVYSSNTVIPTLYNGRATEPSGIQGPDRNYAGDGIPPC